MKWWQLFVVSVYLTASIVVCDESTTNSQTASDGGSTDETSHLERGIKTLYEMTHNFLDLLGTQEFFSDSTTGAITYKDIEAIINNGTYSDLQTRWQDLVKVWGPFAACVIVALLFIIFMPLAGCFFCCCFCCCKRCGKASDVHDPPRARCKRITLCTFLFIFTTLMMTGAIVAAISNEILHQKLENVNSQGPIGKFQNSLDAMESLASTTVEDIQREGSSTLDATVNGVISNIEDAAKNAVDETKKYINADTLLQQTEKLGRDVDTSLTDLNTVTTSVADLKTLTANISDEFSTVSAAVSSACSSCDVSKLSVKSDFDVVPDLSSVTSKVQSAQSLTNETKKATDEFKKVEENVNGTINSQITDAKKNAEKIKKDVGQNLDKVNATVFPLIQSVKDNIRPTVNEADATLKKNGDYWWYGGIAASCLVLLVVLCYYLGILFGIFGDRPGPGAQCCNRGAGSNFLVCGVLCSYLFASILMLVVMITFLTGGLMYTVICRDLNNGVENVKKFENILDDTADLSLRKLLYPDNKSIDLTIGGMLEDCKQNKALYTAFQLKYQFDIDQLLNISDITSELNQVVDQSFNIDNISIIPADLQKVLDDFGKSGVASINFTSFDAQISKNNLTAEVDEVIMALKVTAAASPLPVANKTAITSQVAVLEALKQNQISDFETKLVTLNTSLHKLQAFNTLPNTTQDIINGLIKAQDSFNANASTIVQKMVKDVVANTTSFVEKEINAIKLKIKNDIGKCRDLYTAAQSISDAICKVVLDPFNAFWFGLGWGLFFYIPSIIFALCLANLYQRQEKYDRVRAEHHRNKKKKTDTTEQFDSPDMEMYHGGGYNAYNSDHRDHRDNMPLTPQYQGGYKGGPDGVHNRGYEDQYRGQRGYEEPPPYTGPRTGQQAYPVLPRKQHY